MFVLPYARPAQLAAHRAALAPTLSLAFERLFDDSFERAADAASVRTPVMDVSETDVAYTVSLEVPGLTREQLKVSVLGRRVTVETVDPVKADDTAQSSNAAQADAPAASAAPRVLYRERRSTRFARTVSLPTEVDQAGSQAKFDNGVLTLTLAKKVAAGATQISIG
jgi:HSP20 family protein